MPVTKHQLVASIRDAYHIEDRGAIAAFILDDATEFGTNPFRRTSAGAQRQSWSGRSHEFRALGIQVAGLPCLLQALALLPIHAPLEQEVLRAGPFTAYIYHDGDGCRVVGAVLHAREGIPLPSLLTPTRRGSSRHGRSRMAPTQLEVASADEV